MALQAAERTQACALKYRPRPVSVLQTGDTNASKNSHAHTDSHTHTRKRLPARNTHTSNTPTQHTDTQTNKQMPHTHTSLSTHTHTYGNGANMKSHGTSKAKRLTRSKLAKRSQARANPCVYDYHPGHGTALCAFVWLCAILYCLFGFVWSCLNFVRSSYGKVRSQCITEMVAA